MNSMPFRQLKSFFKILIGVQYEFDHRGLHYHIWEFPEPERGAQSNVRIAGRSEEFGHNYEEAILEILKSWEEF